MTPRYSAKAAPALGYLKRKNNEIEVYVEDTGNRAMWLRLIKGALPKRTALRSINMLGGRHAVEEACRLDQTDTKRRRLYIVDADFDKLLGKRRKPLRYLYRLNAYCVENLFVNEQSALNVAEDSLPNETTARVTTVLDYATILAQYNSLLKPLFTLYAIAFYLDRSLQTVGFPVTSLMLRNGGGDLDRGKLLKRAAELRNQAVASGGLAKYKKARRKIVTRASRLSIEASVSGKDYLLPMLWLRLKTRCSYKGNIEQLKVQLAKAASPKIELGLRKALENPC